MAEPDTNALGKRLTESVQALTAEEKTAVTNAVSAAIPLVRQEVGEYTVPDEIRDLAIVEVASDLYFRRNTRNGVMDVSDDTLQPFRINRDPLAAARPILRPFTGAGLGIA